MKRKNTSISFQHIRLIDCGLFSNERKCISLRYIFLFTSIAFFSRMIAKETNQGVVMRETSVFVWVGVIILLSHQVMAQEIPPESSEEIDTDPNHHCPCHDPDNLPRCVSPPHKPPAPSPEREDILVWHRAIERCLSERQCALV